MIPTLTEAEVKPYIEKKFIAQVIWAAYLIMSFLGAAGMLIGSRLHPVLNSLPDRLSLVLKLVGGNAINIFPIFLLALIADGMLKSEGKAGERTWLGRLATGAIVFVLLWVLGFLVSGLVAFTLK